MTIAWRAVGILLVTVGTVSLVPRLGQAHGSITTTVLFDREIVSLLERRCVSCHNEGGLSFPLSTYEETWVKRLSMRTEVLRRHMPPWAAVPGYGEFANDNGLTLREQQFLVSWVEGLGPRNAGSTFLNVPVGGQAPAPVRASVRARRVAAGQARSRPGAGVHHVPPSSGPVVQRATIDLGLTEPGRIGAIEFLPGDRRRLRAARFRVESTGQWLGSWTPWYGFAKLPQGVAFQLPAGTRLSAELHYAAGADPVTDVGTVGLFRAQGASAPPSDLVVTARSTPGRSRVRRGSARLAVRRDDLGPRPGDSAGHAVPGAVGAASRRLDRSPAARRAAARGLADALRVQVAGAIAARDRAALRARDGRPLDCAGASSHQPLRPTQARSISALKPLRYRLTVGPAIMKRPSPR